MVNLLKSKHAAVVQKLEEHGVKFNTVDRPSFEARTSSLFSTLPGVNIEMYDQIQNELKKIRSERQ